MKRGFVFGVLCVLSVLLIGDAWVARTVQGGGFGTEPTEAQKRLVVSKLSSMPLSFTENKGQFGERTKFRSNALGAIFYFAGGEVTYFFSRETDEPVKEALGPWVSGSDMSDPPSRLGRPRHKREGLLVHAKFVGANPNAEVSGEDMLPHKCNYFYGDNPSKWRTNVPNYSAVRYRNIYPGIDLKYYGDGHSLKYDFIVKPGADPSQIEIEYDGVNSLSVNAQGELLVSTQFGDIIERVPSVYQEIGGDKREILCRYVILERDRFSFALDNDYDRSQLLYIDPELSYSTYLGGGSEDTGHGIAVDGEGCAYVTGYTGSTDFPTVIPYDEGNGGRDVFIIKLSASGDSRVYCTYLGGRCSDYGAGIAVDGKGCAYVMGGTQSMDFPTANPYDESFNGYEDVFVTKLSSTGDSLVYSTYLGGSAEDVGRRGIAVDNNGCAYVTGYTYSSNFPTANAYDGSYNGYDDVFATKFSAAGDSLIYSTYLGGNDHELGYDIAVDGKGYAYLTGWTQSKDFPTTSNGYDTTHNGEPDVFVIKLSISGDSITFGTYLGGSAEDQGWGIAVDGEGCAYVTGYTYSTDFPTVNPYDGSWNGGFDVFLTKLSAAGDSLIYSTYLGGSNSDYGLAIAVDDEGFAYVTGLTQSIDFPTANPYDGSYNGYEDVFVTELSTSGNSLVYSTYLGGSSSDDRGYGIAVNGSGNAYVTGFTESTDFPTVNPYQSGFGGGGYDAIVAKFENANWIEDKEIGSLPFHYHLSQNYPNPFNPITEIKYTLPRDCWVRLEVYNILGQKVASLVDGEQKAGFKTVRWDAGSFSSGIYFYRLKAGGFVETKKMVLIR